MVNNSRPGSGGGQTSLAEPQYPTDSANEGPFSFNASGFQVYGYSRKSYRILRRLLFPEMIKRKRAMESLQEQLDTISTGWITAQLKHYGIDWEADLSHYKLKARLLTAFANGEVSEPPSMVFLVV